MQDPADRTPDADAAPLAADERGDGGAPLDAHLEGLFTLAQAVTLDALAAARLVDATFERAHAVPREARPVGPAVPWLYGVLLELHAEGLPAGPAEEPSAGLRGRLAERVLDRVLPVAFTGLPEDLRLLLVLCDVQGFTCADAGRVCGLGEVEACDRLEQARRALYESVRAGTVEGERRVLDPHLSAAALRSALARMLQAEFAPVPPTLRLSYRTPREPRPEDPDHLHARPAALGGEADDEPTLPPQRLGRLLMPFLLLLVVGVSTYLLLDTLKGEPERNLITLSAQQAEDVQPALRTDSPREAERFVREELGWRLTVPGIEEAALVGVSIGEVAPGVRVPVFFYEDAAAGGAVTLYAYNYALLDRFSDRVQLESDVLNELQDDTHFDLHDLGEEQVLIWRNRDDIFVAVTRGDAEHLRQRISFPS